MYLVISPVIFFNTYSLILVVKNKKLYNQYYSMNYLNEFIFCDEVEYEEENSSEYICFFDKINKYNNTLYVCYIIATIITILFPIILVTLCIIDLCEISCSKLNLNGSQKQKLNQHSDYESARLSGKTPGGLS